MNSPLTDATFENVWRPAIAATSSETTQDDLVSQLRTSIRKINTEHAKALQNSNLYLENLYKAQEMFCKGEAEFCSFSSWCRFPIYEVDFGWSFFVRQQSGRPDIPAVAPRGTEAGSGRITACENRTRILPKFFPVDNDSQYNLPP
nr:vinorine synthase-like [Ipomoea batatas]